MTCDGGEGGERETGPSRAITRLESGLRDDAHLDLELVGNDTGTSPALAAVLRLKLRLTHWQTIRTSVVGLTWLMTLRAALLAADCHAISTASAALSSPAALEWFARLKLGDWHRPPARAAAPMTSITAGRLVAALVCRWVDMPVTEV